MWKRVVKSWSSCVSKFRSSDPVYQAIIGRDPPPFHKFSGEGAPGVVHSWGAAARAFIDTTADLPASGVLGCVRRRSASHVNARPRTVSRAAILTRVLPYHISTLRLLFFYFHQFFAYFWCFILRAYQL